MPLAAYRPGRIRTGGVLGGRGRGGVVRFHWTLRVVLDFQMARYEDQMGVGCI